MKRKNGHAIRTAFIGFFFLFLAFSWAAGFEPGRRIGYTFAATLGGMMKLLPCAFILIGLFDIWVKRETIERYFGEDSGIMGCVWAILLAGTTVGGLYVAFPVAYSLYKKGASLRVIFAYISFSGSCRIPMTVFEASFMGPTFTAVRLVLSVPLILLSSVLLGSFLAKRGYALSEG